MLFWIFDLDYTLYDIPKNIPFKHSYLTKNDYLGLLLSFLPDKKVIYTNSNISHCNFSLKRIGIEKHFEKMITKDIITIASNTKNVGLTNKYSFKASLKNSLCGDKIKLELSAKNLKINLMKYETES